MHGTTIKKYSQELKIVTLQGLHSIMHSAKNTKCRILYNNDKATWVFKDNLVKKDGKIK
jgi:hypothetical protein